MRHRFVNPVISFLLFSLTVSASCGELAGPSGFEPPAPTERGTPTPTAPGPMMKLVDVDGPTACGPSGAFCWAGSLGTPPSFHKVWGVSASDLWIVGTQGTLLHYNGLGWSLLQANKDLHGLWGAATNDVWAVGDAGTILHWNGIAWSALSSGTTSALYAVWGASASDVWAVGDTGTLMHWDGTSWAEVGVSFENRLHGIWGASATDIWAVGAWGMIVHYNGTAWTQTASPIVDTLVGLYGNSTRDVWAVGAAGAMLHWDGTNWIDASRSIGALYDIAGTSTANAWAVGDSGQILTWDGSSWATRVLLPFGSSRLNSVFAKGNQVWAVGDGGSILQWDSAQFVPTDSRYPASAVRTLFATRSNDVWATGDNGFIARWNGSSWTVLTPSTSLTWLDIWGTGPNDVWVSASSDLYHWDGTKLISMAAMGAPYGLESLWGFGTNNVWGVRPDNKVFRYNGTSWSSVDSGRSGSPTLRAIWGTTSNDVWIGGSSLYRWNGLSWTQSSARLPSTVQKLWGSGANDIWATGQNMIAHYSGGVWTTVAERTTNNSNWHVWGTSATDVFFGGDPVRLLHHDGKSFTATNAPGAISAMAGYGSDIFVGTAYNVLRRQ